jgi:ABC-type uncharacterized transport system ATPase subunit
VTRTETDRLVTSNKLSAIHGCYASALTLIAGEVTERAKVPLITGSSSDQLNKGRSYTFTPFARACSRSAAAMLKPRLLMLDEPLLGLAPVMTDVTFEKIGEIHRMGTAILLVEQNVSRALALVQCA